MQKQCGNIINIILFLIIVVFFYRYLVFIVLLSLAFYHRYLHYDYRARRVVFQYNPPENETSWTNNCALTLRVRGRVEPQAGKMLQKSTYHLPSLFSKHRIS